MKDHSVAVRDSIVCMHMELLRYVCTFTGCIYNYTLTHMCTYTHVCWKEMLIHRF